MTASINVGVVLFSSNFTRTDLIVPKMSQNLIIKLLISARFIWFWVNIKQPLSIPSLGLNGRRKKKQYQNHQRNNSNIAFATIVKTQSDWANQMSLIHFWSYFWNELITQYKKSKFCVNSAQKINIKIIYLPCLIARSMHKRF